MSDGLSRFGEYSRSTAFAVSLSARMVGALLRLDAREEARVISADLAARFDWYQPMEAEIAWFTTDDNDLLAVASRTLRALLDRGLVEIGTKEVTEPGLLPGDPPEVTIGRYWRLSEAGCRMAEILRLAGFDAPQPNVRKVPVHPDDRVRIEMGGPPDFDITSSVPPDRRWDLMAPGDDRYFAWPGRPRQGVTR